MNPCSRSYTSPSLWLTVSLTGPTDNLTVEELVRRGITLKFYVKNAESVSVDDLTMVNYLVKNSITEETIMTFYKLTNPHF